MSIEIPEKSKKIMKYAKKIIRMNIDENVIKQCIEQNIEISKLTDISDNVLFLQLDVLDDIIIQELSIKQNMLQLYKEKLSHLKQENNEARIKEIRFLYDMMKYEENLIEDIANGKTNLPIPKEFNRILNINLLLN